MKESLKWIIIVLLLAGVISCAYLGYNLLSKDNHQNGLVIDTPSDNTEDNRQDNQDTSSPAQNTAPNFRVYDKDGNEVRLTDMKGKPVVVNFWATWCPYCVMEMPDFEEAFKTYGEDIQFMMINVTDGFKETLESAKAYVEENKYTFPVYYDTKLSAAMAYSAYSLPCTFFIDADGVLDSHFFGRLPKETLWQGIDRLLK